MAERILLFVAVGMTLYSLWRFTQGRTSSRLFLVLFWLAMIAWLLTQIPLIFYGAVALLLTATFTRKPPKPVPDSPQDLLKELDLDDQAPDHPERKQQ